MMNCYEGCENCENPICSCSNLTLNEDYLNCKADFGIKWTNCIVACDELAIKGLGCHHYFVDGHSL